MTKLRCVPVEIVAELAAIGEAVCDLSQNRKRPDSEPIMGWDNAKLTLGTVRKCRAMLAAAQPPPPEIERALEIAEEYKEHYLSAPRKLARALRALEQTNAAGHSGESGNTLGTRDGDNPEVDPSAPAAPHSEPYWLIERGSPCEWWVSGYRHDDGSYAESWTKDASQAQKFSQWGATQHIAELISYGVKGNLIPTEHLDLNMPHSEPQGQGGESREAPLNAGSTPARSEPESPPTQEEAAGCAGTPEHSPALGGVPSNAELDALVERLNTFEQSDDLGDGDFSLCVEAASALVALRAMQEIEQPYRTYTYWKDRAEAAERDAARYLWLREPSTRFYIRWTHDDGLQCDLYGHDLDAAIDAARGAEKAKP